MTNLTIISPRGLTTPTIAEALPDGAVTVRRGAQHVTLSAEEVARLVAVATGHASSIARTRLRRDSFATRSHASKQQTALAAVSLSFDSHRARSATNRLRPGRTHDPEY
jgi:hypothetical protein